MADLENDVITPINVYMEFLFIYFCITGNIIRL
jgi:hypothetical protein